MTLEKGEQELLGLLAQGKLKKLENAMVAITEKRQVAMVYRKKDAKITIRLSNLDLERIKKIAIYDGLPYQTLISSILHEYASRDLLH